MSSSPRLIVFIACLILGCGFVAILTILLPADSIEAGVLLDRQGRFPYPFTIQNLMWVFFFAGLGELGLRASQATRALGEVNLSVLPEDEETMLRAQDLAPYAARAKQSFKDKNSFLQKLILRVIWQFQGSRSLSQANEVMKSSIDLFQNEIDLRYNMIRYVTWLIPTLGFIGTVIGIAFALETAGNPPAVTDSEELKDWMKALTADLGVAFNTTLVALLLSAVLVFIMHLVQEREELALNRSSQYCLDNLINRLYDK